jgi:hypothetical protein
MRKISWLAVWLWSFSGKTLLHVRGCIQKFPDWPPGERTANDTALSQWLNCIAILWVSLVSYAAITLGIASQRLFIFVYFVIDSVRKRFDTPSYLSYILNRFYLFLEIYVPINLVRDSLVINSENVKQLTLLSYTLTEQEVSNLEGGPRAAIHRRGYN